MQQNIEQVLACIEETWIICCHLMFLVNTVWVHCCIGLFSHCSIYWQCCAPKSPSHWITDSLLYSLWATQPTGTWLNWIWKTTFSMEQICCYTMHFLNGMFPAFVPNFQDAPTSVCILQQHVSTKILSCLAAVNVHLIDLLKLHQNSAPHLKIVPG